MKKLFTYITLFFIACTTFSCKSEYRAEAESIAKTITSLKTTEEKRAYLENMFHEYQLILKEEELTIRQFGDDSPEFEKYLKKKSKQDKFFLNSISTFFDNYGYPSRTELGQYASIVPLIIHFYASDNQGFGKENFKYIYGAFKFNDIPKEHFLAYLHGYYEVNQGKAFVKKKSMSASEEIYAIMDAMNIEY